MVLAQNVGSNTLAMLEIAVIISASPQVWCFGESGHACLTWIRCRGHFGIGDRKNLLLAGAPPVSHTLSLGRR